MKPLQILSTALIFSAVVFAQGTTFNGCPVFPAHNMWNRSIDTLPLDPHSTDYVNNITPTGGIRYDAVIGITVVPGTQPLVPINLAYPPESDPGPYPYPPNAIVEPGDQHVIVVDKDHCMLYESYNSVLQPDGSWNVDSAAKWSLLSDALRPLYWTSADAAGLPIMAGLVRYEEILAGQVTHAIRFTVPHSQRLFVWPARHYASFNTSPLLPPMGQRFRLKAGFDVSPYSPRMQVILRAMKKYGIVVADNGLPWEIQLAADPRWDSVELDTLRQVAGANFEAVDVSSLMVDPNSGEAVQPTGASVAVAPASVSLGAAQSQQFSATVSGSSLGVVWSMNPTLGTLSASGLYTAPSSVTAAQTVTVTATLSDNSRSASAVVTLQPAALPTLAAVSVSPNSVVGGTNVSVTVTLTAAAPAAGAAVTLTGSNPAFPGATVTVPAGASSQTFSFPTTAVATATSVSITASYNGSTAVSGALSINPVATTPPASFTPIVVNAGGGAYTDPQAQAWSADTGYSGGYVFGTAASILNTATPALYQSCRFGPTFQYQFAVPNGGYTVTLKFAEPYFVYAGGRSFNVAINGTPVLTNFDIVAQAKAPNTAIDRSFPVTVANGTIAIAFTSVIDNALISAIQIASAGSVAPPAAGAPVALVHAGGGAYTDPQARVWSADTGFSGGTPFGTAASIANTTTPALYQTCRYGAGFQYQFAVPNGSYTVTLKFSEPYWVSAGRRIFNVAINGAPVLTNFDVIAQAGAANTAIDRSFPVTVANGQIAIQFTSTVDNALISAIQITNP